MKVGSLESLGAYLREQRRSAEMSLRQLAQRTGVSNPYLSQIERGLRRPSAEVVSQLAKALQISAETLYVRAGWLDPSDLGSDDPDGAGRAVEVAIKADRHLTERHKHILLDIYASFRTENSQSEHVQSEHVQGENGQNEQEDPDDRGRENVPAQTEGEVSDDD